MEQCKVIALTNQKGGVGKTTTTVNIGIALAKQGKRVLLIDNDPQASLTLSLGFKNPDDLYPTVTDVMNDIIENGELTKDFSVLKSDEGVNVLPANLELCGIEVRLVNEISREQILKTYTDSVRNSYDYVLIDCMPSLGMLTFNALVAADRVIIPTQPEYLSAKGLETLIRNINRVKKRMNPDLTIDGILLTMVDSRTNLNRNVSAIIRQTFSGVTRIYNTAIPRSVKAAEASADGKSIFTHEPKGKVASAYFYLSKEVNGDGEKQRVKHRTECVR